MRDLNVTLYQNFFTEFGVEEWWSYAFGCCIVKNIVFNLFLGQSCGGVADFVYICRKILL